jgi:hypothetical protein
VCLQGASATGQLLREIDNQSVRVFAIWEPVLPTDFAAPSTAALARIPDLRAVQYWDRSRALSHLLGERNRSTVVWDYIAVYQPGTLWQDAPPKPVYSDGPVRDAIGGAKNAIQRLLASGGSGLQTGDCCCPTADLYYP